MFKATKNLFMGLGTLILTILLAALSYSKIEKHTFFDSIYYVFNSITTLGAPIEVLPKTFPGKLLGMLIVAIGMGMVLYIVMIIAKILIEGEVMFVLSAIHGGFKMMKKPKNHIIVCGYGKLGRYVCKNLEEENQTYVVIEENEEKVNELVRNKKLVVHGDALNADILKEANIAEAKALITVLPTDADNIYLIMSAKELNPDLIYASKATDERAIRRLHKIGAQIVVLPEVVGGRNLVKAVLELQKS